MLFVDSFSCPCMSQPVLHQPVCTCSRVLFCSGVVLHLFLRAMQIQNAARILPPQAVYAINVGNEPDTEM